MRKFIVLSVLLVASIALGDAVIFSGADVKALKFNLDLFGRSKVMGLNVNPSVVSTAAPLGSLGMDYLTGNAYFKTGTQGTDWDNILVGPVIPPSTISGGPPNTYAVFDQNEVLSGSPFAVFYSDAISQEMMGLFTNVPNTISTVIGLQVRTQMDQPNLVDSYLITAAPQIGAGNPGSVGAFHGFMIAPSFQSGISVNNAGMFEDFSNVQPGAFVDNYVSANLSPNFNQTTMNQFQNLQLSPTIGNTSATHLDGYTGITMAPTIGEYSDIDNMILMNLGPNIISNSQIDGYTGVNYNPNINGGNISGYRSMILAGQFAQTSITSVNNVYDLQVTPTYYSGAIIGSYDGIGIFPNFNSGVTLGNVRGLGVGANIDSDSASVLAIGSNTNLGANGGVVTIGSYQDLNLNPNFGSGATIGNYQGLTIRPNVTSGANVTGAVTMIDVAVNSTLVAGTATGLNVDVQNISTPGQKTAIQSQGGLFSSYSIINTGAFTPTPFATNQNSLGGAIEVIPGAPLVATPFFGNNLGSQIIFEDDATADNFLGSSSLGYSMNGFVNQIAGAAGKTFDTINYMAAGGSFPAASSGGTVTNLSMFRALGLINAGGTLTIDNEIQFHADAAADLGSPTNLWGFRSDATTADNFFQKNLIIGGATKQPSNASIALEIATVSGAFKNASLTTAEKNALTPLAGMQVYDTDLSKLQYYDGVAWLDTSAGASFTFPISVSQGGTGLPSLASGSLLVGNGMTTNMASLPIGASNTVLASNGSVPVWISAPATGVTEVALTASGPLLVTGSPVKTSGTIAITYISQASGTVFAGPIPGATSAPPTFRQLVQSDLPVGSISSAGQSESPTVKTYVLRAPYNQITTTASEERLIETGNLNILVNPGFEATIVSSGWTASAGTAAAATGENIGIGLKSVTWTPNASGDTFMPSLVSIPNGLKAANGHASVRYKTAASGTSFLVLDENSNMIAGVSLPASVSYGVAELNYIYPANLAGSVRPQIKAVSNAAISLDDFNVGASNNIGDVAQPYLLGTVKVTGCAAFWDNTSASFANFPVQTSCVYTTTGSLLAPTTMIPGFRIPNLQPGHLSVVYEGVISTGSASGAQAYYRFHDGTNAFLEESEIRTAAAAVTYYPGINGSINYSTAQSNLTIQVQAKNSVGSNYIGGLTANPGVFKVYYWPTATEKVVNSNTVRPPTVQKFTTAGSSTYNTPPGVTHIKVRMVGAGGGGAGAGTTVNAQANNGGNTTFGSSLLTANGGSRGIFDSANGLGTGGTATIAAPAYGTAITGGTGGGGNLNGTATTNASPNLAGGSGGSSALGGGGGGAYASAGQNAPANTGAGGGGAGCPLGTNSCASGGGGGAGGFVDAFIYPVQTSYTYSVGSGGAGGTANGTGNRAGGNGGDGYIEVTEYYGFNAPVIIGSVTSNSTGAERVERAHLVNNGSTCVVSSQSGSFMSGCVRNALGDVTATITSGLFSSTPVCVGTATSGSSAVFVRTSTLSTTAVQFITNISAGTASDANLDLICMGPR